MTIKVLELIGISKKSFDDALNQAVKRAISSLRGVTGVSVIGQNVVVEKNKVVEYRVNCKVAFMLE